MRFEILCDEVVIGTSALEGWDDGMGIASGPFVPGEGYAGVKAVFRMYAMADGDAEQLELYWEARDRLGLRVRSETGVAIEASWIQIEDFTVEAGDDALGVVIKVASDEACRVLAALAGREAER